MDQRQKFKILLDKYLGGKASEKEIAEIESRYTFWNSGSDPKLGEDFIKEKGELMWGNISSRTGVSRSRRTKVVTIKRLLKIGAAAAAVGLFIYTKSFFSVKNTVAPNKEIRTISNQTILPGKQEATLVLSNGKVIKLTQNSNGKLAEENGVVISKSADGELIYEIRGVNGDSNAENTLYTAKGETYQVKLPDGSMVCLNAASSLTYRASLFKDGKRAVKLKGEGYFQISKDRLHPFVVETENQRVEVLGTTFNINAYEDEPGIRTTLIEGAVKISIGKNQRLLKPGFELFASGNKIQVSSVDTRFASAWINNKFIFESGDLKSIMRMLERWYNIEVIYEDTIQADSFYGSVPRLDDFHNVLGILEKAGGINFRIQGRKVYVSQK